VPADRGQVLHGSSSTPCRSFGITVLLVGILTSTVGALPPVGTADSPAATAETTDYYLENAYKETGVKNAVTAVLASYRGFDTMGEAVVVFAAGVGLLVVLQKEVFE